MGDEFSISRIEKVRYRPTREAEEFLESLRKEVVPGEKFRVARLAFARSLQEPTDPPLIEKGTDTGSAIEGTHLFGEHAAEWAAAVVAGAERGIATLEEFRLLVEAHWHRGAHLLQADFDAVGEKPAEFALMLANRIGARGPVAVPAKGGKSESLPGALVRLSVRIGEVGIESRTNSPAVVELNAPGASPHIAVMGKTRSGKTRTGLEMAQGIAEAAGIPMLFIDPKGEFVKNGRFVKNSDWGGRTLADRLPGAEPLDVPIRPIPLDFLSLPHGASGTVIAQAAIAFRDSFKKCIKAKGDVAMDNLRETVEGLLREGRGPVSLDTIRDAVRDANESAGKKKDGIEAKLNELTSLRLFEPAQSPAEFFRRRWVIGLGGATEESRKLVMFLLLDALANHLLSLEDASTDAGGYRAVRHLLVVDEAKEILSFRHGALSNLVRKSAAKGGIVMLLSQSPEDFDREEDDFLSQMGTIAVFNSNAQSVKNLRAALGRRVDPEDFSDKNLPKGVAFVKMPHRDPTKVIAWK